MKAAHVSKRITTTKKQQQQQTNSQNTKIKQEQHWMKQWKKSYLHFTFEITYSFSNGN